ncbi:MAG: AMP-binding protein [Acidobacteriota bacterium]
MPNFCDRIAEAAARFPHHPAVIMSGESGVVTTSYSDLVRLAGEYAAWLHTHGVRRGDRVAILAANDPHWIAAYLGTLRIGAVAVPLDTAYASSQVATIVADAGARVLFTSVRLEPVAREAAASAGVTVVSLPLDVDAPDLKVRGSTASGDGLRSPRPSDDSLWSPGPSGPGHDDGPTTVTNDDPAAILYTSGTTADPKGVVLTHGNLEAERAAALAVIHVTDSDAVLGVLPLFHALAQMANLLLPLSAGSRVVFLETVNSATLLEALEAHGITVFACVPQFFYLIHQRVMGDIEQRGSIGRRVARGLIALNRRVRDLVGLNPGRVVFRRVHRALGTRMRMLITGGSRFDPGILEDLYGLGLTILNGYGLTETSGAATVMRPGDRFTASVGQPLPGVEVRIAPEPELSGDRRDEGEILIRGPIVMHGYFNRPEATAEAFDGAWLRTGDLGRIDRDGRVYITGRKKDVIVLSSGKNLYPEEIEAHYQRSAFVRELCVMGLTDESAPSAERLHAIVVPDDAALRARGAVNVRELIRFELEELSVGLPPHKRILGYDISRDALPRTSTGKLRRGEIERQHRARALAPTESRTATPEEDAWLAREPQRTLATLLTTRLGRPVHPDDNLELDLHLDSLERVEVLAALERAQGAAVAPETRATIFTVRQLFDAVAAARPNPGGTPSPDSPVTWTTMLAARPESVVVDDLTRRAWLRAPLIYALLQIVMLIGRAGVKLQVTGRARLPASGAFIVTPNHQSYLDGFLVAGSLPFRHFRHVFFVGAAEYFQTPSRRALARAFNIVPVDPDAHLMNAMQAAADGLRAGKILVLFPEGERTIDGQMRPFRKGAAILASELGVPVVPTALDGMETVWPRGRGPAWRVLLPWRRVAVRLDFGELLTIAAGDHDRGTIAIQQAVASRHRASRHRES